MRHRWGFKRLGRDIRHRKALLKNLATALIRHERIVTTLAKAKELRKVGDRMITLGKRDTESSRQKAWNWMRDSTLTEKLFGSLKQRYAARDGGYTRVLRAPNRKGDNAPMAVVELVGNSYPPLQPACFSKKKKVFNSESNTKLNELRDSDAQTMSKSLDQPPKLSTKTVVPPEGTPV